MENFTELTKQQKEIVLKLANKNWIGSHQGSNEAIDDIIFSATDSMTKEAKEEVKQNNQFLIDERILKSYGSRDVKRINKDWYHQNSDYIDDYKASSKGLDRIERND